MEGGQLDHSSTEPEKTYNSFSEAFIDQFPMYLSIGMPSEEYWNGHAYLVCSYRKAEEMRSEKYDYLAWLLGMYAQRAILASYPVPAVFPERSYKPENYPTEPFLTKQVEKAKPQSIRDKMLVWAASVNAKYAKE